MLDDADDWLVEGEPKQFPLSIKPSTEVKKSNFLDLIQSKNQKASEPITWNQQFESHQPNQQTVDQVSVASSEGYVPRFTGVINKNRKNSSGSDEFEYPWSNKDIKTNNSPVQINQNKNTDNHPMQSSFNNKENQEATHINKNYTNPNLTPPLNNNPKNNNTSNNENQLNTQNEQMKTKYELIISNLREKNTICEENYKKTIEALQSQHKTEIASMDELYKEKEKILNAEIARIKTDYSNQIQLERERWNQLHQIEWQNQNEKFKSEFQAQQVQFEAQTSTIRSQVNQQIELNNLAMKFENSSKQIEELAQKVRNENDQNLLLSKASLEMKEKSLQNWEERLKETEKHLLVEKEILANQRQEMENREIERKKNMQSEQMKIQKEILRLQQWQNTWKSLEFQSMEQYNKDSIATKYKQNEMKMEMDTIISNYETSKAEWEHKMKVFEEEKKFFEKYKEDAFKNIDIKKANYEIRQKQLYQEEKKLKQLIKSQQEKEFYLNQTIENIEKQKEELREQEEKNKAAYERLIADAMRIQESVANIEESEKNIMREKELIEQAYNEIENEKIYLKNTKLQQDQDHEDIKLRMQTVDNLRMRYVWNNNTPMNNAGDNNIYANTATNFKPDILSNRTLNFTTGDKFSKTYQNNFRDQQTHVEDIPYSNEYREWKVQKWNAEEYYKNLQKHINSKKYEPNEAGVFNSYLVKQQEYLQQSNEYLENQWKKTNENLYMSSKVVLGDQQADNDKQ